MAMAQLKPRRQDKARRLPKLVIAKIAKIEKQEPIGLEEIG